MLTTSASTSAQDEERGRGEDIVGIECLEYSFWVGTIGRAHVMRFCFRSAVQWDTWVEGKKKEAVCEV
jgi:hypothetical protein